MNSVILIGNLTKDPELTSTQNNVSVCKFTVAVTRKYANAEGNREADFIPIVTWRAQADNCGRFLKKGSKVAVRGSIQMRTYDAQDGQRRFVTEVVAEEVQFLSTRQEEGLQELPEVNAAKKAGLGSSVKPISTADDTDYPF